MGCATCVVSGCRITAGLQQRSRLIWCTSCWVTVVGCCHRSRNAEAWRHEPVREYIATSPELCGEQKWFDFFKAQWSRHLLTELKMRHDPASTGEDVFMLAFTDALKIHADRWGTSVKTDESHKWEPGASTGTEPTYPQTTMPSNEGASGAFHLRLHTLDLRAADSHVPGSYPTNWFGSATVAPSDAPTAEAHGSDAGAAGVIPHIVPAEPTVFWAPETFCSNEAEQDTIEVLYRFVIPPTKVKGVAEPHDPTSVPHRTQVAIADAAERATGQALLDSIERWISDVDIKDRHGLGSRNASSNLPYTGAEAEVLRSATWQVVHEYPELTPQLSSTGLTSETESATDIDGAPDAVVLVSVKVKLPEWQLVAREQIKVNEQLDSDKLSQKEKEGSLKALPHEHGSLSRTTAEGIVGNYMTDSAIGNIGDSFSLLSSMALAALLIGYFSSSYWLEFNDYSVTPGEYCASANTSKFAALDCFMVVQECLGPGEFWVDQIFYPSADYGYTDEFPCEDFTSSGNRWLVEASSMSNETIELIDSPGYYPDKSREWQQAALDFSGVGLNVTCNSGNFGSSPVSGVRNFTALGGNDTSFLRPYTHLTCYVRKPSGLQLTSFIAALAIANTVWKIMQRTGAVIQDYPLPRTTKQPTVLRLATRLAYLSVLACEFLLFLLAFPPSYAKLYGVTSLKEATSITSSYGLILPGLMWILFNLLLKLYSQRLAYDEFIIDTIDARRKLWAQLIRRQMQRGLPTDPEPWEMQLRKKREVRRGNPEKEVQQPSEMVGGRPGKKKSKTGDGDDEYVKGKFTFAPPPKEQPDVVMVNVFRHRLCDLVKHQIATVKLPQSSLAGAKGTMRHFVLLVLTQADTGLGKKKAVFKITKKANPVEAIRLERYDEGDEGGPWGIRMTCTSDGSSPQKLHNVTHELELGHRKRAAYNLPGAEDRLFLEWFCRKVPDWDEWSFKMTESGPQPKEPGTITHDDQEPLNFLAPLRLKRDTFEFWLTVEDRNVINPKSQVLDPSTNSSPSDRVSVGKAGSRALRAVIEQLGDPNQPSEILKTHFNTLPRSLLREKSCWGNCKRICRVSFSCGDSDGGPLSDDQLLALFDFDDAGRSLQRRYANGRRVRHVIGEPARFAADSSLCFTCGGAGQLWADCDRLSDVCAMLLPRVHLQVPRHHRIYTPRPGIPPTRRANLLEAPAHTVICQVCVLRRRPSLSVGRSVVAVGFGKLSSF